MNQLTVFRRQLALLRVYRAMLRWFAAACGWFTAILCLVVALFCLDYAFRMDETQRVLALSAAMIAGSWAFHRWAWPLVRIRESEIETASFVQRQHGIDSDLVAAIQFARSPERPWGSHVLVDAAVKRAGETASRLNLFAGLSHQTAATRAAAAVVFRRDRVRPRSLAPGTSFRIRPANEVRRRPLPGSDDRRRDLVEWATGLPPEYGRNWPRHFHDTRSDKRRRGHQRERTSSSRRTAWY